MLSPARSAGISYQEPVLAATGLLARGIDIGFLPCVINYGLPRSPKDDLHRIGRTGRAQNPGEAISLVSPEEMNRYEKRPVTL